MPLSLQTKKTLARLFTAIAESETFVEKHRQQMASLYDFEPYAVFCRLDADGDKEIFTIDLYKFLHQNDKTHISLKDC